MLEGDKVKRPCELINEKEVEEAIKVMKAGKAGGPSEMVGKMLKAAGKKGIKRLTELCNQVVREGAIPREWELSTLIPISKGKGDPMQCGFIQSSEAVGAWDESPGRGFGKETETEGKK